jgi:hypothetical protein
MVEYIAAAIIVVVFGPRFIPVFAPRATGWPAIYFVFGALQIIMGLVLYYILYSEGFYLPWALVVCLYGLYYLWRGQALRKSPAAVPRSGAHSGGGPLP